MSEDVSAVSVLCVDDEPGMADLVGTYLERFDDRISATSVTSAREALDRLDSGEFDCIVSDHDMPDLDGLVFLETVRADRPEFPFVFFTGRGSERIASDAVSAGVSDYMQKRPGTDQYRVLARRIHNAVMRHRPNRDAETGRRHAEPILEASPNAVLVSIDGECVYANPAAADLLSRSSAADIVDTRVSALLSPGDSEDTSLRDVERGEEPFEQERLSVDAQGETVPVEGTAREITWGGTPAVVYVFRDVSDRVEREQGLEYRQSLLDAAFDASPDGIIVTDVDGEVVTYNDRFADVWDLSTEIIESSRGLVFDVVGDRTVDPESFRADIDRLLEGEETTGQTQVRLRDGTVLDQRSAPVRSEDGTHLGYVWFYRDVTDLTGLERTQQEAFDRMTDAVLAVDESWEFTFLNEQAERLLQRDADELLGEDLWSEFEAAADSEIYDRYHEAVETGEPVAFESSYEPLGAEFEIRAFPSETGLTVYFRDVTEQRRTRSELETGVEALHELYEVASDLSLSFEEKRQELTEIGSEYLDLPYGFITELTETTQLIVASTGTHELLQPGEACPLEQSYCRKTTSTESGLLAVQNAAGEGWSDDPAYDTFELDTYIGGKILVDGDLYGTVCFAAGDPRDRDFSEMEWTFVELLTRWLSYELEQRNRQSRLEEKNAQLEEFASVVSHDLRNPLNVADGYLELAIEETDSEHLHRVEQAHDRMADLIEDILTLAREGDSIGDLSLVDLAAVGEAAWKNVETAETSLAVETDATIRADESRITQLLENLFRNAVEHGGTGLTVRIGDLPGGFYVEDTGEGIPEDERARLFSEEHPGADSATGIGLRVVDRIVTAHDWEVDVTSGPEGGARFEITGVECP